MEDSELRNKDILGEVVWAKLPGWRWWPAKVEQVDPEEKKPIIVRFFGSKDELGILGYSQVREFESNFSELSASPNSKLEIAIQSALGSLKTQLAASKRLLELEAAAKKDTEFSILSTQDQNHQSEDKKSACQSHNKQAGLHKRKPFIETSTNHKLKIKYSTVKPTRPVLKPACPSKLMKKREARVEIESADRVIERFYDHESELIKKRVKKDHQKKVEQILRTQDYLENLAENLNLMRTKPTSQIRREGLFRKIHDFVSKCFHLDDENLRLLVQNKLAAYLTVIYQLLLDINDPVSDEYSKLLPTISKLLNHIKSQTLSFFKEKASDKKRDGESDSDESGGRRGSIISSTKTRLDYLYKPSKDSLSLFSEKTEQLVEEIERENRIAQRKAVEPKPLSRAKTAGKSELPETDSDSQKVQVKLEEPEANCEQSLVPRLRRKILRKVYQILHHELGVENKEAQEIAIRFEEKVFTAFPNAQPFVFAVKTVCQRLRAFKMSVEEFRELASLPVGTLQQYIDASSQ